METNALLTFASHVQGKNAQVTIYSDRIEWTKPGGVSGGKVAAGLLTGGASLLFTGVAGGQKGSEMMPIKSISSVTTARDGMVNTKVVVVATGNTVEFRVGHAFAPQIKDLLTQLILGSHPSQNQAQIPASSPAPVGMSSSEDVMSQLSQLAQLKASGILTQEEFDSKKSELLKRI